MYNIREYLTEIIGIEYDEVPSDELYCCCYDLKQTLLSNNMQERLACFAYLLVCKGWLAIMYNGKEIILQRGDLFIFSPGMMITTIGGSDNFQSICLLVDEDTMLETSAVHKIIHTIYQPIAEVEQPVMQLNEQQEAHFCQHMLEIIKYLNTPHLYREEILKLLLSQFVFDISDVSNAQNQNIQKGERTTELFIDFLKLLSKHYKEHHDLIFYADKLNITTIHLSRIVRQITGSTVAEYINKMLIMEAVWMLKQTNDTLADIARQLNFTDQSSFGRFFKRMKGISPKKYRNR